MNIITVIPLTRSKVADTLSYFTAAVHPVGAIVSVPLRSKNIYAIITESRPAEDLKAEIKRAPFEIRKLAKVKATQFFPATFIETCRTLSDYYASKTGAVIDALVADVLLENAGSIQPPLPPQKNLWNDATPEARIGETFAIQADDADRLSTWRSLIRQEFARKKSISIYVPSIEDARNIFAALERGIEGYIFMMHGGLTTKKTIEVWSKIADTVHPVVVVATGSFLLLPRSDIGTVIIERENGRGWISQKSPYLDLRHAIETHARKEHQTVYLADSLLRTESLRLIETAEITEGTPFKWRSVSTARDTLVDMRGHKGAEETFKIISPELENLIKQNRDENAHLFILAVRRGVASSTICSDCETILSCPNCSAPVVLHASKITGKNFYLCHKCGERRNPDLACSTCGGWRLTPLGIGIDRVAAEISSRIPDADVFQLDADLSKTDKQTADIVAAWRAKPGGILLGTEMALTHLSDAGGAGGTGTARVDHIAVASLDSLFALPDFRIQEKIVYTLILFRSLASRSILVQTRKAEEKAFEYGLKGNLADWSRAALSERKQFAYPPFTTLIKITLEGSKSEIARQMADIQKSLQPHQIDIFPAFTATVRGKSVIHGLIKIEQHAWPDRELVAKLRNLPPGVSVKVNPESLL